MHVGGYDVILEDTLLTGTFSADGSEIGGVTLAATLDTRPLSPLLDDTGDPAAMCNAALSFGVTCEPCPADGEPYCLAFDVDDLTATEVRGDPLVAIAAEDCGGCTTGPPPVCP